MHTARDILIIANFLGSNMTEEQADDLMASVRDLSIADREMLLYNLEGGPLYTRLSMNNAEMGGYGRY